MPLVSQIAGDRSDFLHLLALNALATDPAKAYLLFTQYQRWHNGVYGYGTHLQQARHIGLLSFSKILVG